jgi:hypothetical protein
MLILEIRGRLQLAEVIQRLKVRSTAFSNSDDQFHIAGLATAAALHPWEARPRHAQTSEPKRTFCGMPEKQPLMSVQKLHQFQVIDSQEQLKIMPEDSRGMLQPPHCIKECWLTREGDLLQANEYGKDGMFVAPLQHRSRLHTKNQPHQWSSRFRHQMIQRNHPEHWRKISPGT